jgi:hypothetical protein
MSSVIKFKTVLALPRIVFNVASELVNPNKYAAAVIEAEESGSGLWTVLVYSVIFSGCPNKEICRPFLFNGLILGTCSYFGADSAT